MTDAEIAELVTRAFFDVAPDLEGETINREESFRDQFDVDSMDLLNFIIKLHESTGIDIPEKDYPQLMSLSGAVSYLSARLQAD